VGGGVETLTYPLWVGHHADVTLNELVGTAGDEMYWVRARVPTTSVSSCLSQLLTLLRLLVRLRCGMTWRRRACSPSESTLPSSRTRPTHPTCRCANNPGLLNSDGKSTRLVLFFSSSMMV
jgi:hypothetical protein